MMWFSTISQRLDRRNQTKNEAARDTPLQLEVLEGRQLLDASPTFIDIRVGAESSYPGMFTEVSGSLFFRANDGTSGPELFVSDGTSAGTHLVKDINPSGSSNISQLTNMNGTLFFTATDGVNGSELWMSNGTSAGTMMVKDIEPGAGSGRPEDLININGTLFFERNQAGYGDHLWKSDGTSAGTVLVKDLDPAPASYVLSQFTNFNGTLFFSESAGSQGVILWKSDGTSAGTEAVKTFDFFGIQEILPIGDTLYLTAGQTGVGFELWKSDGTSAGTVLVKDIEGTAGNSYPGGLTNVNGMLFFQATDGNLGHELWKTDGTSAGTELVKDINTGADSSYASRFVNVSGTLFFTANNGTNGSELWKSDGTSAGTQLVKDIVIGPTGSSIYEMVNVNGLLFFVPLVSSFGGDGEVWVSDGTSAGTVLVKDLYPGVYDADVDDLTNVNGTLFFEANDSVTGKELWVLDLIVETPRIVTGTDQGTPGTVRVFDTGGNELLNFNPYTAAFEGGIRVATGDINGDGILDIVTAAGPTGGPHIQVFDSTNGQLINGGVNNFYAYNPAFTGGVYVAVGDVNDDGFDDIITGADAGGGPHIKVFSGQDGSVITEFFAYDPSFIGGVRVAAGDINGDAKADIITAPGASGGPHIRVFSGVTGQQLAGPTTNFFAYDPNFFGGVFVAAGDVNNDGKDDIITAPGSTGGPHIKVFSSADASLLQNFYAYHPLFNGGVRVGSADVNQDGFADIITVPGATGGPHTRVFSGVDLADLSNFYSGAPDNTSGLYVAGGVSRFQDDVAPSIPAAPFSSFYVENDPPEDVQPESPTTKKSWVDDTEEFYQSAEEIDKLFSGLGIE
ncbi:Hypothetical protein PBC10988_24080 [Planctomycetales bacterium 10988]|nr:Hypothetical protein PBC10988_24080 [Planctomycetales bacterium 10988]